MHMSMTVIRIKSWFSFLRDAHSHDILSSSFLKTKFAVDKERLFEDSVFSAKSWTFSLLQGSAKIVFTGRWNQILLLNVVQ
jgi:hypothetical protein